MLDYLTRRWFMILVVTGLIVAVNFPDGAETVFGSIQTRYVAGITLFLMSLGLETRRLWDAIRRPWPALLALAISFGVAPPLAYWAGWALVPEGYRLGLLVAGCVPCSLASAAIWTRLAGGNDAIALMVTMLTNLTVFLFTAGWLSTLGDTQVAIDFWRMAGGLFVVVVFPISVGQLLRAAPTIGALANRGKRLLGVVCRLLILSIIVKSAVDAKLRLNETGDSWNAFELVQVALVCGAVHASLLCLGYLVGRRFFSRADAIAVAMSGSQKTLPVGAYLIDTYYATFPLAIVPMLFYHVGQLLIDTYVSDQFFYRPSPTPPGSEEEEVPDVDDEPIAET